MRYVDKQKKELNDLYQSLWDKTCVNNRPSAMDLIKAYQDLRATARYQNIQNEISQGVDVSRDEYFFFALVTDDVSTLDPDKLKGYLFRLGKSGKLIWDNFPPAIQKFKHNLNVLVAALRAQNSQTVSSADRFASLLVSRSWRKLEEKSMLNLSGLTVRRSGVGGPTFKHCFFHNTTFEKWAILVSHDSVFFQTRFSEGAIKSFGRFQDCDFIDLAIDQPCVCDVKFVNSRFNRIKLQTNFISSLTFAGCKIESSSIETNKSIADINFSGCTIDDSTISFGDITQSIRCSSSVFTRSRVSGIINPESPYGLPHATFNCQFVASDLRASSYASALAHTIVDNNQFSDGSLIFNEEQFSSLEALDQLLNGLMQPLISRTNEDPVKRYEVLSRALKSLADILCSHIAAYSLGFAYQSYGADLLKAVLRHPLFNLQGYGVYVSQVSRLFPIENASTPARANIQVALDAMEPLASNAALCALTRF